jgi:hypothetical protein
LKNFPIVFLNSYRVHLFLFVVQVQYLKHFLCFVIKKKQREEYKRYFITKLAKRKNFLFSSSRMDKELILSLFKDLALNRRPRFFRALKNKIKKQINTHRYFLINLMLIDNLCVCECECIYIYIYIYIYARSCLC